ncbi:uncharacterized protein C2orf81 homolog [Centropristis striata]|uniref:uncharacterized protein C2orf81 homolog n=1 Tax=Centropristis striata TaxID=184440 RepID=UPI0027E1FD40|nr:uncharacterized protein C2orf81 homolog [Centropristis striata]XP_059192937.1 uncharacterized protein C2orf81 homolog [Centropristis striata]
MPRSAAKSQPDKQRDRSSAQGNTPPPQDLEVEDIILGRLTQAQWMDMLVQVDADEAVGDIIEELLSKVMAGCFKVDIERKLVPFCASWAKSYLTQIIERQILCPDEGEAPEQASKTEDSEPMPATSDAWVQGCVPVVNAIPLPHSTSQQDADIGRVPVQTEPRVNQQCDVTGQTNNSPRRSEKKTSPRSPVSYECSKVLIPHSPTKFVLKKRKQVNLPLRPVASKLLPPLSCSVKHKDVDVEGNIQTHSVYNQTNGLLHHHNNYQSIPKLDPSRLSRHCIFPQYCVDNSKPNSGPLSLDTMVLAKGVTLLDPQAVEMNPLKCKSPTQSTKLRPIRSDVVVPLSSVKQFTGPLPQAIPMLQSDNCDNI